MIQAAKPTKPVQDAALNELRTLQKRGRLHALAVVEFADDPNTALHSYFEWDSNRAAHEYRLEQARHLIRTRVVILPRDNKPIRAFVHLESDQGSGGGYREIEVVLRTKKLRDQLLEQALREFHSWRAKYEHLKKLEPVFAAAEQVKASLEVNGPVSTKRRRKATAK